MALFFTHTVLPCWLALLVLRRHQTARGSTMDLFSRLPDNIRSLQPYVPGKPIEEVERELGIAAVKLASNENPLGPSPLAMEAACRFLRQTHRYPIGDGYYLRQKLARTLDVSMDEIIVESGST